MTVENLRDLAFEHAREAFARLAPEFPAVAVDSWSEPAYPGEWVIVADDEGRRSQVEMSRRITCGVAIVPGDLARRAKALATRVVAELADYARGESLIVSRPLPEPEDAPCTFLEVAGVWIRLTTGFDPDHGREVLVAQSLLGRRPDPLAESEGSVVWI